MKHPGLAAVLAPCVTFAQGWSSDKIAIGRVVWLARFKFSASALADTRQVAASRANLVHRIRISHTPSSGPLVCPTALHLYCDALPQLKIPAIYHLIRICPRQHVL